MNKKQIYVSAEGLLKLQERLEYLKTTGRKEAAEEIKKARAFGDLSENSEYDEAKNHQGMLEKEIAEIEEQLSIAVVVEENISTDKVGIGSKVKVYDYDFDEEVEYNIVGSTEADPLHFEISDESPIGKALLGKKVGEEFYVETPGGDVKLKVLTISK